MRVSISVSLNGYHFFGLGISEIFSLVLYKIYNKSLPTNHPAVLSNTRTLFLLPGCILVSVIPLSPLFLSFLMTAIPLCTVGNLHF